MKGLASVLALLLCLVEVDTYPRRAITAWQPVTQADAAQLLDLVPADALAAVEIHDVDRRWAEIRNYDAVAQIQNVLLGEIGIAAEEVPVLAAHRAVLSLVRSESEPYVVPVALLRPVNKACALGIIAQNKNLFGLDGHGAIWVGPRGAESLLIHLASEAHPALSASLPMGEIDGRLAAGGLVRGFINPQAWVKVLAQWSSRTNLESLGSFASLLGAELSMIRYVAFRRDIVEGEIRTEAVAAYDTARLPAEVAAILDPDRPPVPDPILTPPDTIAAASFHLDGMAWLAWLKHVAAADPHGPLRNLDFWLKEFEERFRRDLRRDLCSALGENGWFFLLEAESASAADAVVVIEMRPDPVADLGATLANLIYWAGEHIWVDSLGLLFPHDWSRSENGIMVSGVDFWTPLGKQTCLLFASTSRYLVLATSDSSLHAGLSIARTFPSAPAAADASATHAAIRVNGDAVARLLRAGLTSGRRQEEPFPTAVSRLLAGIADMRMDIGYERDGIRIKGRARLGNAPGGY